MSIIHGIWDKMHIGNIVLKKEWSIWAPKVLVAFLIKYMYMIITYIMLDGQMYTETTNYGINFCFAKEIIASIIFLVITIYFVRMERTNIFIDTVLFVLYMISFIPVNSAFSLNNTRIGFFLLSTFYYVFLFIFAKKAGKVIECIWKNRQCKRKNESKNLIHHSEDKYLILFCSLVCILLVAHKISYNGFEWSLSMNADQIYENRAAYREFTNRISGTPIAYLLSLIRNLSGTIVPFFIMYSLINKKIYGVVLGGVTALSMFAISNQKSDLFVLAVLVGVFTCYKLGLIKHFHTILSIGLVVGIALCFIETAFKESDKLYTLIFRRQMYLPAKLNTDYYDFFSNAEKLLWRQDAFLLKMFSKPVYNSSSLELINQAYYGGSVPSPNTGLFAEAYMHFGLLGIIIYPALLSVIINLMGRIYLKYGEAISVLMGCLFALSVINIPIVWTEMVLSYFLFAVILYMLSWACRKYPVKMRKH